MFTDKIDFNYLLRCRALPDCIIEKYADKLNMNDVLDVRGLPLTIIEMYKDSLDWHKICKAQLLPEDFMKKYSNYIDYFDIYIIQGNFLSDEFKEKHLIEFRERFYELLLPNNKEMRCLFI